MCSDRKKYRKQKKYETVSRIRLIKGANTFRQFKIGEAYTDVANRPFISLLYSTKQARRKEGATELFVSTILSPGKFIVSL